jgi:hypothetical protein
MFLQSICLVVLPLIFMSSAQEILMGLNDGKCAIKLISTKMTWANADKYCAARNSRLFTPFLLGHSFLHKHLFEDLGIQILQKVNKSYILIFFKLKAPTDALWTGLKRQETSANFEWIKAYEQVSIPSMHHDNLV